MSRAEYMNTYQKEHYDKINLLLPKGMKNKIKIAAETMGSSISEYLCLLVNEDLSTGTSKLAAVKKGFTHEQEILLQKLQVPKKYYEMIEDLSFDQKRGYFIILKKGYINDITQSKNIICDTTKEVRRVIVKSHKVREDVSVDGFNASTIEQLEKWQIPKKYYEMIDCIDPSKETGYSITLKEGFTNDFSGGRIIKVEKANLFRTVMKQSHQE